MNVADTLRASAARLPETVALRRGDDVVRYAELNARADRAAAALQQLGVHPGDRVAVLLGNTPTFVVALYGIWRAGGVAVPLNVALTSAEIAHELADSGASVLIVGGAYQANVVELRDTLPDLAEVLLADSPEDPAGAGTRSWRTAVDDARAVPEPVAPEGDALALIQYTSGTTGRARGAMLTHGQLLANQEQMRATRLAVTADDVVFCVLPLFHIYGLNVALGLVLATGATLLLAERFDPVGSLQAIAARRATIVIGAPPMYVAWVNTPGAEDHDLSSVRIAVSGAAPLPPELLERCRAQLGLEIWEGYGLTETAPTVASNAMLDQPRPGSVGAPLPGVQVRITDGRGEAVEEGDPGRILVRGDNVFSGYWHDPEGTAAVLDDDGWFDTGDIGYRDDDGALFLVDRARDLIIVSGFNVYPREVEDVLVSHPAVRQAVVIGVPHPYRGEAVKAVVVADPDSGLTADEVIAFASKRLARFKCPDSVEFVDELPILPTGKVRRRLLRDSGEDGRPAGGAPQQDDRVP